MDNVTLSHPDPILGALVASHSTPTGKPRARTEYRAARRNAAKAARMLPQWRESVADAANQHANLPNRINQANAAREAASKALVDATHLSGVPRHTLALVAMLDFYCGENQTRAVSRIVRDLQRQVRSAAYA